MRITVRIDDVSPGMNRERFERFLAMAEGAGIGVLMGVVPEPRDPKLALEEPCPDFFDRVRAFEERGHCLAMHGVYHVYTTKSGGLFPLNRQSEFAGHPYEEQKRLLAHGKEVLERNGITTRIFMAPSHSYDRATLKALRELGFTGLTDGYGRGPYRWEGLVFYPISKNKRQCLAGGEGITTFVVHPNVMEESDFAFYERLFSHREPGDYTLVSYREMLAEEPAGRGALSHLSEYAQASGKRIAVSALAAAAKLRH